MEKYYRTFHEGRASYSWGLSTLPSSEHHPRCGYGPAFSCPEFHRLPKQVTGNSFLWARFPVALNLYPLVSYSRHGIVSQSLRAGTSGSFHRAENLPPVPYRLTRVVPLGRQRGTLRHRPLRKHRAERNVYLGGEVPAAGSRGSC